MSDLDCQNARIDEMEHTCAATIGLPYINEMPSTPAAGLPRFDGEVGAVAVAVDVDVVVAGDDNEVAISTPAARRVSWVSSRHDR